MNMRKLIFSPVLAAGTILFSLSFFSCGTDPGTAELPANQDSLPVDIRQINEKIAEDRNNAGLYFKRARAWFDHKDFGNAISDMKIVLNIDSTSPDYYIFLSDLYFTQNQTKETRDHLRKALKLDSTHAGALAKYSQLFYLLKKYDTATFYINRSLHYNRTRPVSHFQKGMILKEWGDTMKAISCFMTAIEFDNQYYDAYMQLGILHAAVKDVRALGYFNNAIQLNPVSVEAYYAKGLFMQQSGDYENALKTYEELLKISPGNLDAQFNIGAIYYEQKKQEDAIRQFEGVLANDPNYFRSYYGLGRCYEALGKKKEAIENYRKCLAIRPDYAFASQQLDRLQGRVTLKVK